MNIRTFIASNGHKIFDFGIVDDSGYMGVLHVTREYDVMYDKSDDEWLIDVIDSGRYRFIEPDEGRKIAIELGLDKMIT